MLKYIFYFLFLIPMCLYKLSWFNYIYCVFFLFFMFFISYSKSDFFFCISYNLGMDKYSFIFICLTLIICLLMIYSMLNYMFYNYNLFLFYLNLLILFLFMIFCVSEFFQFYFFFECSMIPVFLIIFNWGYQPERLKAGFFLILYTLFASFPLLLSIFFVYINFGCFNFFINFDLFNNFLSFFIIFSFLVKFPLYGFHSWLPKAHVEAPVSGSMILAGVMLKLGGYGFFRLLPFLYNFLFNYGFLFINFSLYGCVIVSFYCMIQSDLKMLIAYSSVCHMGVVIAGFFTLIDWCYCGGMMMMIGHGFVSSGLFFLVGLVYNHLNTRSFFILKGLMSISPSMTFFWFMFCISNMSCPPSINLLSEFLLVIGLLNWSNLLIFYLMIILFFSACYSMMIFFMSQHNMMSFMINLNSNFFVCDYFVLFYHLFPVFLLILNLNYFFLFI